MLGYGMTGVCHHLVTAHTAQKQRLAVKYKSMPIAFQFTEAYVSAVTILDFTVFEKFYLHIIEIRAFGTPKLNAFQLKGILIILCCYSMLCYQKLTVVKTYLILAAASIFTLQL
jgi:hypothetical protein